MSLERVIEEQQQEIDRLKRSIEFHESGERKSVAALHEMIEAADALMVTTAAREGRAADYEKAWINLNNVMMRNGYCPICREVDPFGECIDD